MFEALFILTTIDTGTRIGRFLMQEFLARTVSQELGKSTSKVGAFVATAIIVGGWTYFILAGSIQTIWPMFGVANQLLACTALCVGTTIILREAPKRKYALITLLPLLFVGTTTITAAVKLITGKFLPEALKEATRTQGIVNTVVTTTLLVCVVLVLGGSVKKWLDLLRAPRAPRVAEEAA
jgi:carbon starvation protein